MAKIISNDRWLVPLTFLVSFVLIYLNAMPLLDDPDVPWHLATGSLLWQTHHLPATDPWSLASGEQPWYLLSWVWNVIIGGIEYMLGAFGVYVFVCALAGGILAFVAKRLVDSGLPFHTVFPILVVAGLCMGEFTAGRPQMAGYVFILLMHSLLHQSRIEQNYKSLRWLPPLMLLWANTHGSFIVGFTLLGAYGFEAFIAKRREWLARLIVITVACFICALINPYGPTVAFGALRSLDTAIGIYLMEWKAFSFGSSIGLSLWLLLFAFGGNMRLATVPIADRAIAAAWFVAALMASRNGMVFVLVSAPYVAACITKQIEGLQEKHAPSPLMVFIKGQPLKHIWMAVAALAFAFTAVTFKLPHEKHLQSESRSIKDTLDFALTRAPDKRYLVDYTFGGQAIYYAHDRLKFFMDSRASTVYSEKALGVYIGFLMLSSNWQENLKSYRINAIIADKTSAFVQAYDNGQYHKEWQLLFAGKNANVYSALPQK